MKIFWIPIGVGIGYERREAVVIMVVCVGFPEHEVIYGFSLN